MFTLSLPGRKLTVNANGSFGPEFLGRHGEFNSLVTLPPHEILLLHNAASSHICAVPLHDGRICTRLLHCVIHSVKQKMKVRRSRDFWVLLEEANENPEEEARQRKLVRLYLDYQRFWKSGIDSLTETCSRDSCDSIEAVAPTKSLKKAYIRKILKELGTRILDFVACVHHRLRSVNESALQEIQQRLMM